MPVTRQIIGAGAHYSATDTFHAQYKLEALKKRCPDAWKHIDALVVPTAGTVYTLEQLEEAAVALSAAC